MNIQDKIKSLWWYHRIELGNGIVTPGNLPHDADAYRLPDLTGKRVLDIGAWDGFWTFEALKRGASQVVAIENWTDFPEVVKRGFGVKQNPDWATFDLCKEVLGYSDEQCQRHAKSLYDITPDTFGMFDVVFMFGTLYHMRHPLLALDTARKLCNETICIETAICDDYSPYQQGGHQDKCVMEFFPTDEFDGVSTNWWSPTLFCLGRMVEAAGWKDVDVWKFIKPPSTEYCRGFAKGTK